MFCANLICLKGQRHYYLLLFGFFAFISSAFSDDLLNWPSKRKTTKAGLFTALLQRWISFLFWWVFHWLARYLFSRALHFVCFRLYCPQVWEGAFQWERWSQPWGPSHITETCLSTRFCQGCECHRERQFSRLSHSVYTEHLHDTVRWWGILKPALRLHLLAYTNSRTVQTEAWNHHCPFTRWTELQKRV